MTVRKQASPVDVGTDILQSEIPKGAVLNAGETILYCYFVSNSKNFYGFVLDGLISRPQTAQSALLPEGSPQVEGKPETQSLNEQITSDIPKPTLTAYSLALLTDLLNGIYSDSVIFVLCQLLQHPTLETISPEAWEVFL